MTQLTEAMAANAFARAWNRLDPSEFIDFLDAEAHCASQWVFTEMVGREAIADYLIQKMQTVAAHSAISSDTEVFAELGSTTRSFPDRDCVLMAQGDKNKVTAVVLFETVGEKITRYDMCIPELLDACRSGEYPE